LSKSLKTSADIFLTDWRGDYKKASRDLFLSQAENSSTDRYKKALKKLINSRMFIELV
jgi:hypothetical protein